jgi:hypothetical protein
VIDSEGNVYTNIHRNERGEWITDEEFKTKEETETPPPPPPPVKTKPTELEKKGVGAAIFTDAVGYGWKNG